MHIRYTFTLVNFLDSSHSQPYETNNSSFFLFFSPFVQSFRREVTKITRNVDFVSLKFGFHNTNLMSLTGIGAI